MNKQCTRWKPFKDLNIRGSEFDCEFPDLLNCVYRGQLISSILAMAKKTPITFEQAARMAWRKHSEAIDENRFGSEPGQCFWYTESFVQWISELGYHIELSGDEFEPYLMSDKLI